jgi:hypothetical protein
MRNLNSTNRTLLLSVLVVVFFNGYSQWNTTGNNVTSSAFLGTLSTSTYKPLVFQTNGIFSGMIDPGTSGNVFFGTYAGQSNTSNSYNTGIGFSALKGTGGNNNTAVGWSSLSDPSLLGTDNTAMGYWAGLGTTNGSFNSSFGSSALVLLTNGTYNSGFGYDAGGGVVGGNHNCAFGDNSLASGDCSYCTAIGSWALNFNSSSYNNALGYQALMKNSIGTPNNAFGYNALKSNTTASHNVAFGDQALYTQSYSNSNTAWSSNNVAIGDGALYTNQPTSTSNGINNTAVGYNALYSNTTGYDNVAIGYQTLYSCTTGVGSNAVGYQCLKNATSSNNNNAMGYQALLAVTSGGGHTAIGHGALTNITTNPYGTAVGYEALLNTTGTSNTAIGATAGLNNTSGANNTYLGYGADDNTHTLSNVTAVGNGAQVTHGSNTMQLGNGSVTDIWTSATTIHTSDGRFKNNVAENVKGLSFIKKLRPVTYNLDTKKLDDFEIQNMSDSLKELHKKGMDFAPSSGIVHSGFIAQEVEKAAKDVGFISSIVHTPANANETYGISYSEIVVPLVKAVQELSKTVDSLQARLNNLSGAGTHTANGNEQHNGVSVISTELSNIDFVVLNEAAPNPFADQTIITYNIPKNAGTAQLLFYDQNGHIIKTVDINSKGKGQLNVYANDLTNGVYSYTLIIDGKVFDTKKMIKQN